MFIIIALSISCSRCDLSNYALKIPSQGQKSLKISHLIYVLTTELLELFKLRDLIKYYLSCLSYAWTQSGIRRALRDG